MSIIAVAPVPTHSRLDLLDTLFLRPIRPIREMSVLDAAAAYGMTPWAAFEAGARLRSDADVTAAARAMPPITDAEQARIDQRAVELASTPVEAIAEQLGIRVDTAQWVRDLFAGGAE